MGGFAVAGAVVPSEVYNPHAAPMAAPMAGGYAQPGYAQPGYPPAGGKSIQIIGC